MHGMVVVIVVVIVVVVVDGIVLLIDWFEFRLGHFIFGHSK